jgi:hypothetical protein
MQQEVLQSADVICSQMISAGGPFLNRLGYFAGILIDEVPTCSIIITLQYEYSIHELSDPSSKVVLPRCSEMFSQQTNTAIDQKLNTFWWKQVAQCTELAAIVPIAQRGCDRLVLSGDHCQLPPAVLSQEADRRGAALSLYGRLVAQPTPVAPHFLDTQFRAHPSLMSFVAGERACPGTPPCKHTPCIVMYGVSYREGCLETLTVENIYDGRLHSAVAPTDRPPVPGFSWPRNDVPVAFVEVAAAAGRGQGEATEGESKWNCAEVEKLLLALEGVLDAPGGVSLQEVGVVTPCA